ncbi:efflux RND transporter periplasmic adaptor subunit [Hyphomicrobium sp.]|uniref:efflux RND transporter periplasmic adaptor subunit n=1 Tax=Hyphomicrobium sp. TaxID=82 RepID=UPI0025C4DEEF|nr:efflux RND transporter periplasmic adaptor subunit [Hyphomicrobium sp.]
MNKPVEGPQRLSIEAILGKEVTSAPTWTSRPELKWAAALLVVALLIWAAWLLGSDTNGVRYVTEPVKRGDLTVIVTATGSLQPTDMVEISSELSGTVRNVLVDYNSVVTAGQTLAELDTDKLKATVDSSRAKLEAAKAKLAEAEATVVETENDLARKRALVVTNAASTRDLQAAEAAYHRAVAVTASMRAEIGVADAQLKLDETNLAKARIISPINGVVLTRAVEPGQTVASSFQAPVLFSIAEDLKQMELQVDVDEADVGKVKVGQEATFSVDAFPDRRFPAVIRDLRFASETIQGVVTYKAVLNIDNSQLLLRPGMTATAEIKVTEIRDALLIPNAALRYTPPATEAEPQQNFLRRLLPGRPPFRPASRPEDTGPNRTVWVLRKGEPTQVEIVVGSSDGRRTEVQGGAIGVDEALIVDQTTTPQ